MTIGRLQIFIFALVTAGAAKAAIAQDQSRGLQDLSGFAVLNGTCQRFIMAGKELTKACDGKVINTMFESIGRTGFAFVTHSSTTVTFSGVDTPAKGDQAQSIVDRVIVTIENSESDPLAVEPDVLEATGSCTYTNPYVGPSHINCSASTKEGPFSASFVSDGSPPDVTRM